MGAVKTATVSPGNSEVIDSDPISPRKTGKLKLLLCWAARPFKIDLREVINGVQSDSRGIWESPWEFAPPTDFAVINSIDNLNFNGFRVLVRNQDTGSSATDIHVTFYITEV
jgi:hypothetical protein